MDEPMPGSLADTAHQPMPAVEPFPLTPKVMGSPFDSERQAPALHLALGSHSGTEDSSPRRCPSPWGEALRDRGMCSSTIVSPHRAAPSASSSGRRHSADAASQKDGHSHVGGRRSPWTKSVFPSRNAFDFDLDDAPPLFRHALQKMVVHPEAPSSPEAHPSEELEQAAAPPVAVGPSAATPPPSPAPLEHTNNIDPHPSPAEITLPESILLPSHIGTPNGPPSHSPSHSGQGNEAFALPNSTAPLSSSSSRNTVSTTRSHPSFTVSSASRGSLRAPIRSHPTFVSQSQSSDGAGVAVCPSGTAMPLARTAGSPTIHTIPSDRSPPSVPNFVTLDGSESGLLAAVHMATFRSGDHNNSRGRMYRCLEVEEASDPLSQVASTPVAEIALPETHDNAAAAVGGWSCPYTIVRQRRGRSTGSSSGGSSGLFQSGIVERSGENTGDHCGHPDAANDFSNGLDSSCPGEEENGGGCGRAMPLVISTSAAGEGCSSSGSGTQVSPHTSPFTRHRRSKLGANGSIGARVSTTRVSAISSSWQQPSSSASQTRIATSEHLNVNGKTRKNGSHSALSGMAGHHHHNGWSRTFASSSTQHHAALNHHVNPCAGSSDGGGVEGDEGNFFSNSSLSMSSTLRSLTPGNIPLHHSHHGASPLFGRFGNAPPPSMLQHLGLSHSSSHSHLGNFGNSRSELYLASLHQQQLLRGGLVQALAQSSTSVTAMDTSDVGWYVQSTTTSPSLASALLEPPLDAGASSSTQISFSLAPTWEIEEREGGVSGLGGGGGNSIMSASALSTTSGGSPACILFPHG